MAHDCEFLMCARDVFLRVSLKGSFRKTLPNSTAAGRTVTEVGFPGPRVGGRRRGTVCEVPPEPGQRHELAQLGWAEPEFALRRWMAILDRNRAELANGPRQVR